MSAMRRIGLGLAAAGTLCWVVVVWAILFVDGSPVGPAMIAALGFALSIAALIVLLLTLPTAAQGAPFDGKARSRAVALAVLATVLLIFAVVLGSSDAVSPGAARSLLFGGVAAFIGSTGLIAMLPSRRT